MRASLLSARQLLLPPKPAGALGMVLATWSERATQHTRSRAHVGLELRMQLERLRVLPRAVVAGPEVAARPRHPLPVSQLL